MSEEKQFEGISNDNTETNPPVPGPTYTLAAVIYEGFELLGLYQLNLTNNFELGFSLFTEDYQYLFGEIDPAVPQNLRDAQLVQLSQQGHESGLVCR